MKIVEDLFENKVKVDNHLILASLKRNEYSVYTVPEKDTDITNRKELKCFFELAGAQDYISDLSDKCDNTSAWIMYHIASGKLRSFG